MKEELDVSRSKFKELETTYEDQMEQILTNHKAKLQQHVQIVKQQAEQIKQYNRTIDNHKHQIEVTQVHHNTNLG